jgi:hypothetical protein
MRSAGMGNYLHLKTGESSNKNSPAVKLLNGDISTIYSAPTKHNLLMPAPLDLPPPKINNFKAMSKTPAMSLC